MKLFFIVATFVFSTAVLADSPLTSTYFAQDYATEKMVIRVKDHGLDKKALGYLANEQGNPVIKIAMINELGWGKAELVVKFENYLLKKRNGLAPAVFEILKSPESTENQLSVVWESLTADDLMCWAYLQAMGDYFQPARANNAATLAHNKMKTSMAHATVFALIRCQIAFDESWCQVYKIGTKIFEERQYIDNQLSSAAVGHIMEYLNLYQGDC